MGERAQMGQPIPWVRWGLTSLIFVVVMTLVGREALAMGRDGLATCAPDCSLGAPLFTGVGHVEATIVVGVLLAAAIVPLLVRRRWGDSDG